MPPAQTDEVASPDSSQRTVSSDGTDVGDLSMDASDIAFLERIQLLLIATNDPLSEDLYYRLYSYRRGQQVRLYNVVPSDQRPPPQVPQHQQLSPFRGATFRFPRVRIWPDPSALQPSEETKVGTRHAVLVRIENLYTWCVNIQTRIQPSPNVPDPCEVVEYFLKMPELKAILAEKKGRRLVGMMISLATKEYSSTVNFGRFLYLVLLHTKHTEPLDLATYNLVQLLHEPSLLSQTSLLLAGLATDLTNTDMQEFVVACKSRFGLTTLLRLAILLVMSRNFNLGVYPDHEVIYNYVNKLSDALRHINIRDLQIPFEPLIQLVYLIRPYIAPNENILQDHPTNGAQESIEQDSIKQVVLTQLQYLEARSMEGIYMPTGYQLLPTPSGLLISTGQQPPMIAYGAPGAPPPLYVPPQQRFIGRNLEQRPFRRGGGYNRARNRGSGQFQHYSEDPLRPIFGRRTMREQ
ncbi:hypothetical protein ACOME3_003477 [Neoechinorhynchus agilis]